MAKIVNIVDGTGSEKLINGDYEVSASVNGYDNTSIDPSSLSIIEGTDTYAFTIAATGTLTLHVTEDGTTSGVPIVGATFIRTDSLGTEYGSEITTNDNGDAVFSNVPFDATMAPTVYFKQKSSDGNHEFLTTVLSTTLTTNALTMQITNAPGALRTINLTDANYENLPVGPGTITFTN